MFLQHHFCGFVAEQSRVESQAVYHTRGPKLNRTAAEHQVICGSVFDIKRFVYARRFCRELKTLNLSGCSLMSEGAVQIAAALTGHRFAEPSSSFQRRWPQHPLDHFLPQIGI